jgi:CubicO group peptidase (beta-lactamase class C family)
VINKLLRGSLTAAGAITMFSSPAAAVPADFGARADALLKSAYPADAPGVAVIVVDDGKVVYSAGRGLADVEARRAITPATVFRLGSITKQFTSAVILQLAQEGKLSLSDPLSKYLRDYPKPGADVTITQLLNHTSGIKSYTGIPGWMAGDKPATQHTTEQLIAEFKDQPADFAAGTEWRYNNSGYVLLGAVIEKVTGKPWHVAVDERISKPLGLKTIRYGALESGTPNMALGYAEQGGKVVPSRKIHMSVPHAAGALIGSVEDLAKWAEALHKGKVVSPASYAQMIAPTRLSDGKEEKYGFGLAPDKLRGHATIGHGGGIFGFDTASVYIPDQDVFVAVFANSDEPVVDPDLVMARLAALAAGNPFPEFEKAAVPASEIEPLLGLYSFEGGERRFFTKDGKLFTRRSGGTDMEVFTAGKDRFFYGPATLTWFEVKRDPAGKHVMAVHQGGADEAETSVRTGPIPPDAPVVAVARSVLESYVGSYKASRGIAKVALADDGGLTIQLGGGEPVRLLATSENEFRAEGMDGKVVFHSGTGKVSHLVVHQGGREIRADREPAAG